MVDTEIKANLFFAGVLCGVFLLMIIEVLTVPQIWHLTREDLVISNQTGHDLCLLATNHTDIVASTRDKKLFCTIPEHKVEGNLIIMIGDKNGN